MKIKSLDENTVKLLRTGQVITSVSFAVKELVENSLDASAKNIEINLLDDGLTLIEVKDDGYGISKDDAPFIGLSSYTSKITNFEDLNNLQTYGFRGEALQALCQIADVSIITKTENEEVATLYILDSDGIIVKTDACHRSVGTTVQVNGLFKKMPVRRQMFFNTRRANQDLKYLENFLKSMGIIHPYLRVTYRRNKQLIFMKLSAISLIESINNVLGTELVSNLRWIEENCPEGKIQLMIPKKEIQDQAVIYQAGHQYIFINKRVLLHKSLEKILNQRIQEYFNNEISNSKKCLFFLNIEVQSADFDVNLEPNKTKGFLKNEKEILKLLEEILAKYYQLGESKNEYNEIVVNNKNNETEWPACKKRKVDLNRKSSIDNIVKNNTSEIESDSNFSHYSTINSPIEQVMKLMSDENNKQSTEKWFDFSPQLSVTELNLSESDSNSSKDNETESDRENYVLPNLETIENSDLMNFNENITNFNQSIPITDTETLSQLPVVDLGEDFLTQEIRSKEKHMLRPNDVLSVNCDNTISEDDIFEDWNFLTNSKQSEINLKQSTSSFNISDNDEVSSKVNENNSNINIPITSRESWSRGQIPGLEAGVDVIPGEKVHKKTNLTGFNVFCSQARPQLKEKNPEMSVPQIANLLTNHWKEMKPEERAPYVKIEEEKIKKDEKSIKRVKKESNESEKNKRRLLKLLENMRNKKAIGTELDLRARTTVTIDINIEKVTKSFYRTPVKKKSTVIGPLKPNLWIVKIGNQLLLLDVIQLYKGLDFTKHSPNQTNAKILEILLNQWILEKGNMSIMHVIDTKNDAFIEN